MKNATTLMITTSSLKERGWTDSLVKRFLPTPDKTSPNPYYRSGYPVRLYIVSRVEAVEASEAFLATKDSTTKRRSAGLKAAETKRAKLLEQVEAMEVQVSKQSDEAILKHAIRSYNEFKADIAIERGHSDWQCASLNSDPAFLKRIQVNFIRHRLTNYDGELEAVAGKTGIHEAVDIIRGKIFDAIAIAYPHFANECNRQRFR
jgi:hypothetical protein